MVAAGVQEWFSVRMYLMRERDLLPPEVSAEGKAKIKQPRSPERGYLSAPMNHYCNAAVDI